jgi:Lysyl oxidase
MRTQRASAVILAVAALAALPSSAGAATPTIPDLGMARLSDIYLAMAPSGQKQLRFSATIVNVGAGPFELAGSRTSSSGAFSLSQRTYNADGSSSLASTPGASLVFGGDGHNHWHVNALERYELRRLDNGVKVGTAAKSGFCFYDTGSYRWLAGSPASAVYTSVGCGVASSLDVRMGISVGWGDTYPWTLPDQFVDVTSLASGKYRLYAEADPNGWFYESSRQNNATWADVALTTSRKGSTKVRVLAYGPSA